MQEKIIDGRKIAKELLEKLKTDIAKLAPEKPTLAVILAGKDPASKIYVESKKKSCAKTGIRSLDLLFKETAREKELLKEISLLNQNPGVNGILVQLPLPLHINSDRIIESIDPAKDVDGLHPYNLGRLLKGEKGVVPCTPLGIQTLLEKCRVDTAGKHVLIVGRSLLVGKPLAALLLRNEKGANATVTVAHSKTRNLQQLAKTADILISAVGKAGIIDENMVKKEAVVIDVGICRTDGKIKGDVQFEKVLPLASRITPVPGGVGPMTIALLMHNTYRAFLQQKKTEVNHNN